MTTFYADDAASKRDLAAQLAQCAPEVLTDLKRLGVLFGPFDEIELQVDEVPDEHPV